MKITDYRIVALFFFFLGSCTKDISLNFPRQKDLLVVNAILNTDSLIRLTLNKSQFVLENNKTGIFDARVVLFENNQILDTLIPKDSTYLSKYKPKPLTPYKIQIQHPDLETDATAEERIPKPPQLGTVFYRDSIYRGDAGEQLGFFGQISIEILDDPDTQNYYQIVAYLVSLGNNESDLYKGIWELSPDKNKNDKVLMDEGNLDSYSGLILFSDRLFNGETYPLKYNFSHPYSSFFMENSGEDIHFILRFRAVSKNYYQFKNDFHQHLESGYYDIWDGTGEVVRLNGNIQNGYGIFAGYSEVIDTLQKRN